jgi:ribonuclease E
MPNKMLIDATHPEETRVVVLRGNRVEEFDFETAQRKQLRGNIYLAKVTRVEPSLQAAFVEYGGNRHGFLAFSEIHPDYYQIPVADRQALIEDEERAHREAEEESENRSNRRRSRHRSSRRRGGNGERVQSSPVAVQDHGGGHEAAPGDAHSASADGATDFGMPAPGGDVAWQAGADAPLSAHDTSTDAVSDPAVATGQVAPSDEISAQQDASAAAQAERESDALDFLAEAHRDEAEPDAAHRDEAREDRAEEAVQTIDAGHPDDEDDDEEDDDEETPEEEMVESVGGDDALEEVPERAFRPRRQYKIQEVIKRRQVMLIQVVKEERGNKGAALTTYLSLAGRYAVLMPNTARGGGISRKITSAQDRARLKDVVQDLDVPEGMGIILRTAGAARTKPEIKRDFEYLLRLWETVRDLTLKSSAPTLVYEEGSLIKRSIRDLYNKEIEEILVAGQNGYTEARDFMKMLLPTHTRSVKQYRDRQPLFSRMGIESQLDAMFSPTVQLRSGGYIVINQTEALVSIDVNSGRSTREHHIEDTALKTNLEAAEEVARQLRLRDLAGLIVIDFIDMDEKRNNRAVERKMSDCLRHDRARIQVGRISHFGLLEMSRQRIRASVLESSTEPCAQCGGSGHVRSVSSVALQLLRSLEETLMKGATHNLIVRTRTEVALYVLNHKRGHLRDLESNFDVALAVIADPSVTGAVSFTIDRGEQVHTLEAAKALLAAQVAAGPQGGDEAIEDDDEIVAEDFEADAIEESPETSLLEHTPVEDDGEAGDGDGRTRRRRRRRRGGRDDEPVREASIEAPVAPATEDVEETEAGDEEHTGEPSRGNGEANGDASRRRRRGRRGGRRRRGEGEDSPAIAGETGDGGRSAGSDDGESFLGHAEHEASERDRAPHAQPHDAQPQDAPYRGATSHFEAETAEPARPAVDRVAEPERDAAAPVAMPPEAPAVTPERETASEQRRRRSTVREKVTFAIGEPEQIASPATQPDTHESAAGAASPSAPAPDSNPGGSEAKEPRRAGWWSRRFGGG